MYLLIKYLIGIPSVEQENWQYWINKEMHLTVSCWLHKDIDTATRLLQYSVDGTELYFEFRHYDVPDLRFRKFVTELSYYRHWRSKFFVTQSLSCVYWSCKSLLWPCSQLFLWSFPFSFTCTFRAFIRRFCPKRFTVNHSAGPSRIWFGGPPPTTAESPVLDIYWHKSHTIILHLELWSPSWVIQVRVLNGPENYNPTRLSPHVLSPEPNPTHQHELSARTQPEHNPPRSCIVFLIHLLSWLDSQPGYRREYVRQWR